MAPSRPYVEIADGETILVSSIRAVAVVAAAFVLAALLGQVGMGIVGVQSVEALQGNPLLNASVQGLSFVGFLAASAGYLWLRQESEIVHFRTPRLSDAGWALVGVVGILVAALVMGVVVEALSALAEALFGTEITTGQNSIITQGQQNPRLFLYMIPVALFLVGPGEELVFRGVVQGLFRRSFGVGPGLIVASGLFGLGHYFAISSGSAWTYILVAGALGLVLGVIYEYTENIVVPAVTHGLWNAGLFAIQYYLATTGAQLPA
jgi:membrane protease YdiL (CAAX protease family)